MGYTSDWPGSSLLQGGGRVSTNPHRDPLSQVHTPEALAAYLQTERQKMIALLAHGEREGIVSFLAETMELGLHACYAFSDLTDAFLARLLSLACLRAGVNTLAPPLALIATGGYGRRELCPFSDVDITFVPQRDSDPRIDRVVREMFTQIMDICIGRVGLKVGYAYRLMEDCAALDHQTATGLLDARLIAGSERLFIQFEDAFWEGFNPADFIFTKLAERRRVLARWGILSRVVEPQLKEGPGGLRDIQTAVWLLQAHEHLVASRVRGQRSLEVLHDKSYLTMEEAGRLSEAKEYLLAVRNILHARSGAAHDILVRTRQEEVADRLGYDRLSIGFIVPQPSQTTAQWMEESPPVERFMADVYPKMALIRRAAGQIMEQVENSRMMLGIGLDCCQRRIVPANGALETEDPLWLLWVCELAQKYDLNLGDELKSACETLLAMQPRLPDPHTAGQIFTRILHQKGRVAKILQIMADLGILGWLLPEFGRVMNLIPYDPAHDFTVGQHTLNIVHYLDQLAENRSEAGASGGYASVSAAPPSSSINISVAVNPVNTEQWESMRRIMQELGNPEQLILAALLHDCGKALPGERTHAEIGTDIAARVCERLRWDAGATENVVFLIRHHLLMAETSRLRDLNLEETIHEFAHAVGDTDRLDMLYLLTYADTRAVGEGVWTQLNGRFLYELWQRASAELSEATPTTALSSANEERLERARRRMVKDLKLEKLPEEEVTEHVGAMPPHYLLNQSPEQIALHIAKVRRVRQEEIVVDFFSARDATYTELTVCVYDDPAPGLLAKITGVLYAAELVGHSAQVFTRVTAHDRIALDMLWVDFRGRQLSSGKQQEVARWLRSVLRGELTVGSLLSQRRTPGYGLLTGKEKLDRDKVENEKNQKNEKDKIAGSATRVRSVRNDLSNLTTMIEIEEPDIKAALFWTSQAMARLGWDIQSARVSIFHGAAIASFYVMGARHLSEEDISQQLTDALRLSVL